MLTDGVGSKRKRLQSVYAMRDLNATVAESIQLKLAGPFVFNIRRPWASQPDRNRLLLKANQILVFEQN
jgi:hypothetical protein